MSKVVELGLSGKGSQASSSVAIQVSFHQDTIEHLGADTTKDQWLQVQPVHALDTRKEGGRGIRSMADVGTESFHRVWTVPIGDGV